MRGLFMGASVMKSNMKVQYEIIRKKGKRRITLRITDDARIVVTTPHRFPLKEVDTFIETHTDWIEKNLAKVKNLPQPLSTHTYEDGDIFLVFGNEVVLRVNEFLEQPFMRHVLAQGELHVFVKKKSEKQIKEAILEFYRELGLKVFQAAVSRWVHALKLLPHQKPTLLQMVNYPKRMGCCSKKRELRFALRALMLPEVLIEYLALHEVAHLVHFNHGKDFKDLLTIHMPDWQNHRKEMSLLRNRTARL
jgi:predicted metal-dependent hydrolase